MTPYFSQKFVSQKPFYTRSFYLTTLSASIMLLGLCPSIASASETSKITAVTIYQGNASVTRELPILATGEQQVVFGCLSGNVEQDSIQVTASEGVNIGEMNVQNLTGEQAKLCQRQGNQSLANTQNQLDSVTAKLQAQENTLAYLENFGKVTQLPATSDIKTAANHIKQSSEDTLLAISTLRQQKAQLESQLASDMNASTTTANRVTQVSVKLASRTAGKVSLNYLVNGASWQPQYQASLDTKAHKVTLTLQAIVAQTTGENWQNIPLTLSTVQPSYLTALAEPTPTEMSLYDPKIGRGGMPMPMAVLAAPVEAGSYDNSFRLNKKSVSDAAPPPLPSYQASINNKSDIVEYQLPQRVSIPSDGRRITTQLDSQTGQADIWVRVTPNEEKAGYWYAKANLLNKQWTEGKIRLYRDGNYVGVGDFDSEKLSKDGLGFGINKQILVTDLNSGVTNQADSDNKSTESKTGLFTRKGSENYTYHYRIKNGMTQPMTLEVVEAHPVATDSEISIKSSFSPPPTTQTWHDKKNILAWLFNLNPQEAKDVKATYQISYPKDKQLQTN